MIAQYNLVNTPDATKFMQEIRIPTGRKALLGDKERLHNSVFNAISFANSALSDGADKIAALANDPTRSEPERHAAAKQVADKVNGVLAQSKATFVAAAGQLANEANSAINDRLKLATERQAIHGRMADWVEKQAGKPEGLMTIREAAKTNSELVAVLYHYPHFLLGLSEDNRAAIVNDGFKRFVPQASEMLEDALKLEKWSKNYDRAMSRVSSSFYSPALADHAARRVEV